MSKRDVVVSANATPSAASKMSKSDLIIPPSSPEEHKVSGEMPTAVGRYANSIQCTTMLEEFVLDFCTRVGTQMFLASRVIISPAHAKRLVALLQRQLKVHEKLAKSSEKVAANRGSEKAAANRRAGQS